MSENEKLTTKKIQGKLEEHLIEEHFYTKGIDYKPYILNDCEEIILWGVNIVRAINLRIRYCETAIDFYNITLAEEKAKKFMNTGTIEKLETFKTIEMKSLTNYVELKDKLFTEVDEILEDKSTRYRYLFKEIFLKGTPLKRLEKRARSKNYKELKDFIQEVKEEFFTTKEEANL